MSPPVRVAYWVKCDRDREPHLIDAPTMLELLRYLERLMAERGPIEFMVRD